MSNYFQHGGSPVAGAGAIHQPRTARSAALLIDFDNVTLGVHSDLGRELKALINSEVFRGKIAVRRAYADWRRYPNYVVPLTEASIDLIFAPAYGSSKKNTTDLRMSADAIELAFTRPEIDTFILLTGDSDFSSTVMKLKEYGKYVIGVGMRESSSDLIIQNCDEYFSYHTLTGLTRTTAGEGMKEDPWELALRAAQKMAASGDAMRTDRLKQVMLGIDPGFNEKELGYSKFSRFVSELEKKGLVRLHKLPDGQYEISVDGRTAPAQDQVSAPAPAHVQREGRGRDSRRDRRGRRREPVETPRPSAEEVEATAPAGVVAGELTEEAAAAPVTAPAAEAVPKAPEVAAAALPEQERSMQQSLGLLQRAVRDLAPSRGATVRDGDVKRRMVELDAGFDEGDLGFSKFSRYLRAAHDAEAIDLERLDSGSYEVKLGSREFAYRQARHEPTREAPPTERATEQPRVRQPAEAPAAPAAEAPATTAAEPTKPLRSRRRGRGVAGPETGAPPILPGQTIPSVRTGTAASRPPAAEEELSAPPAPPEEAVVEAAAEVEETSAPASVPEAAATPVGRRRGRRGRRDRVHEAPPEILPDQIVEPTPADATEAEQPVAESLPEPEPVAAETTAKKRRPRGRGRKGKVTPAEELPAAEEARFSAEAIGLPSSKDEIATYIAQRYRGVGKKTVEPLVEAFGADTFRVFNEEPHRVREILGDRRADIVLARWAEDLAGRTPSLEQGAPDSSDSSEAESATGAEQAPRSRSSGGRSRRKPKGGEAATRVTASAATAPSPVQPADQEATVDAAEPRKRRRGGRGRKQKNGGVEEPSPAAEQAAGSGSNGTERSDSASSEDTNGKSARGSRSRGGGKPRARRKKTEPSQA